MTEQQFQSSLVIKLSHLHPEKRGLIWGSFSEHLSSNRGGKLLSLGLISDLPDLIHLPDSRLIQGIELKLPYSRHKVDHVIRQAKLLILWGNSWFCDTEEMFFGIIDGGVGICPYKVLAHLETLKTKTFKWDSSLFV